MQAAAQALRVVLAGLEVVAGPAWSVWRARSNAQLEERAVAELQQQNVRMPVVVHEDHAVDCATHAEILSDQRCNVVSTRWVVVLEALQAARHRRVLLMLRVLRG